MKQPTTTRITQKEWEVVYEAVCEYVDYADVYHEWMTTELLETLHSAFLKIRLRLKGY